VKTSSWDGVEERNLWSFHRLAPLVGVKVHTIITGCVANHTFVLAENGIYCWGRNESGELGLGDTDNRYKPTLLSKLNNPEDMIVGGACGDKHSLLFTKSGVLYTAGSNEFGQLGTGQSGGSNVNPSRVSTIDGVRCSGAGRGFSVIGTQTGKCYSFGYPKDGVLGHGSEGKFLGTGNRWEYSLECRPREIDALKGVTIADLQCGALHTIAADVEGKVWTWGFGGYGRLGHGDNKTQLSPKPLEYFHNVPKKKPEGANIHFFRPERPRRLKTIAAGSRCCFGVDSFDQCYFWGVTKSSGEATMYPKLFDGLSGWRVREISSGFSSTICAAEDSLIAWGPSPTSGELGYGEKDVKSSTVTKAVDDLEDTNILKVGMGYNHSLAIVDLQDGGKKKVEKLAVFDPPELKDIPNRQKIIQEAMSLSSAGSKQRKRKKNEETEDGTDVEEESDEAEEDGELRPEDVSGMTATSMKEHLKEFGLRTSGKKAQLAQRLKQFLKKRAKKK